MNYHKCRFVKVKDSELRQMGSHSEYTKECTKGCVIMSDGDVEVIVPIHKEPLDSSFEAINRFVEVAYENLLEEDSDLHVNFLMQDSGIVGMMADKSPCEIVAP